MTSYSDPSSLASTTSITCSHLHLDIAVSFDAKVISGTATLTVRRVGDRPVHSIRLDTAGLVIHGVTVDGTDASFKFIGNEGVLGRALQVQLPTALAEVGDSRSVEVRYETTPEGKALQWLTAEQTACKEAPFLFSQCQAINARSMVPCLDSPGVKQTYSARVVAPVGFTVLMSAMDAKKGAGKAVKVDDDTVAFTFHQKIPIPSYLLAIAVGKLESRKLGPRSAVWAEAPLLDMAAADFADTEEYLAIGESLLGDYVWGRYDLLVLPPSFPFGGMENPTLTFVTPTILSGDKANADVVAHEIAHSWTGNLVGPQTWRDFWLNEGFTVYVERKISARISKKGVAEFDLRAREGWSALVGSVEQMESCGHSQWNSLSPDLGGHDPDDAFSSVPYERGFFFLYHLQDLVGSPKKFEKFVKSWIQSHANQAVTVDQFKAFFAQSFPDIEVDWDLWILGEGLPPSRELDGSLLSGPEALAANIIMTGGADVKPSHIAKYTPKQVVVLLDAILDTVRESETPLHPAVLTRLEGTFKFGSSPNCELKFRWTMIGLVSASLAVKFAKAEDEHDVIESYAEFLTAGAAFATTVGRMKYTRPLYKGINAVGERGRKMAIDTFAEHCDTYHPVTRIMVATDLGLDPSWDSADIKRRLAALRRLNAAEQRVKEAEQRLALSGARTEALTKREESAEQREHYLSRVEPMAQHMEGKLKRLLAEEKKEEAAKRKAHEDSARREQADRANFIAKLATR